MIGLMLRRAGISSSDRWSTASYELPPTSPYSVRERTIWCCGNSFIRSVPLPPQPRGLRLHDRWASHLSNQVALLGQLGDTAVGRVGVADGFGCRDANLCRPVAWPAASAHCRHRLLQQQHVGQWVWRNSLSAGYRSTALLPMAARLSSPHAEMVFRRHAPPAPVPSVEYFWIRFDDPLRVHPSGVQATKAIPKPSRRSKLRENRQPAAIRRETADDNRPGIAAGTQGASCPARPTGAQDARYINPSAIGTVLPKKVAAHATLEIEAVDRRL